VLSWVIFFVNFACTILGEDIREILPGLPYARIRHRDSSKCGAEVAVGRSVGRSLALALCPCVAGWCRSAQPGTSGAAEERGVTTIPARDVADFHP
jgi:hypothetical protein